MEDLIVVIEKAQLEQCKALCAQILAEKPGFEEIGGATIGRFDGRKFLLDSFIHDDKARAGAATIYFSTDVFEEARKQAAERNIHVMGTWHVHPPEYGARFSTTDEHFLFIERMLLKTDDPFAETPRVHLILDLSKNEICAYSMFIGVGYELAPEKKDKSEVKKIEASPKNAMVMTAHIHLDYHPLSFQRDDITGFWRRYDYPCVPGEFEKLYLENFFQKTQMAEFKYIRATRHKKPEYEFFRAIRENKELTTGFDSVPIEIRDENQATEPPHGPVN